MLRHLSFILLSALAASLCAQSVISVGKGSYASYPPLVKSRSVDHGGDQSMYMQTRPLYIREREGQPLPTNDWWTDMIKDTQPFSGHLWSYPQMVEALQGGIRVSNIDYWIANGTEMKASTSLKITGADFVPQAAIVESWHDWDVEFSLTEDGKSMLVTMAHGVPFTWVETKNMNLIVDVSNALEVSEQDNAWLILKQGVDDVGNTHSAYYAVYLPPTADAEVVDGELNIRFAAQEGYVSVAVLNTAAELEAYRQYAYNIVRDTRVDWSYDAGGGHVTTVWNVTAQNLLSGTQGDVLQGFIPHHYRDGAAAEFDFTVHSHATPHGTLKLACGTSFTIKYDFSGMLPYYAAPTDANAEHHPFDRQRMADMIERYAVQGTFGTDTYWGGKGLTQMALYMMFARELGLENLFDLCRSRLKAALADWLTYTPGEDHTFFARYDRWGALIGYNTSYDSETFNDHHFHYGYFTYAGALLCLVDDDFRVNYGPMLRELAKDYANWERSDSRYPLFRTFDPWSGHSFAGGMGDGNGNGQESSSEAMQSWGGLYLLGMALGDNAMRDAGLFGYVSEARAVAEYWFDRRRLLADGTQNIDYTKYQHPYNSNLTCHGVGWWNYFSGDQLWNAAIQWMPISPCLDYLSENLDYARWDYNTAWSLKSIGGWYDRATRIENNTTIDDGSLGDASGLGNVVLSYLQRFDPLQAAEIFDNLYDAGASTARATDTGGITYFITHSHISHGDIAWDVHGNIPSSRVYRKADGTKVYAAYNVSDQMINVNFSDGYQLSCSPKQLTVSDITSQAVRDITPVDESEPDPREDLVMPNLALHKPVTVSGYENAGLVAANLTDGDAATRWGSQHNDNEWCMVNLQRKAAIYQLRILWEAAYANEYQILVSNDGTNFSLFKTMNSVGGNQIVPMNDVEARYVKIVGTHRATQYGISIYELEVYGMWSDATDTDVIGLKISADTDVLRQYEPTTLYCEGYTAAGNYVSLNDVEWSSSDGAVTSSGVFTSNVYPLANVSVSSDGISAQKSFVVEEALYCASIDVVMSQTDVVVDSHVSFEVCATNQFNAPMDVSDDVEFDVYEVDNNGNLLPTTEAHVAANTFTSSRLGKYAIVVTLRQWGGDELTAQQIVNVVAFSDINLALHKPVVATSEYGGNVASRLTDGSYDTRWESLWGNQYSTQWKDDQTLTIDLRGIYTINRVVVNWEAAYADNFVLQVSCDGVSWSDVGTYQGGNGKHEYSGFSADARFVRVVMLGRHLVAYGYSIHEIEVYGTAVVSEGTAIDDIPSDSYDLLWALRSGSFTVYAPDGRLVNSRLTSDGIYELPRGVYIIKSDEAGYAPRKIIVR